MNDDPVLERPPVDKAAVAKSQIPLVLTELLLSCLMLGIYLLLKMLDRTVCLGALLGTLVAFVNHAVMILSLLKAEKAESPAKGQLLVRGNYLMRMLILIAVLVVALKSGFFDPVATLLPLCFMRIAIYLSELFFKKEEKGGA